MDESLLHRFLAEASDAERARISADEATAREFAEALARAVERARAAWPAVDVPRDEIVAWIARRFRGGERDGAVAALEALRVEDLHLACGCAARNAEALSAFENRFGADVEAALLRLRLSRADLDEAAQLLRTQLFLADAGRAPKIADYGGHGDLGSWVRVVAIRTGLRLLRRPKAEGHATDGAEQALAALPAADDPELVFLKKTYGAEFEHALREAWSGLSVRARLLLRQYFGHGLTVDELGALHKVGRSTAARWVTAAREDLVARTRDLLMERLSVGRAEIASIMRLIDSQLASKVADSVRTPGPR